MEGIDAISLYEYGEKIRSLLFQYKGCFDYELKDVFLEYLKPYLMLRYYGYCYIPAPSSKEHDEARGFNHVLEMFASLGLERIDAIRKIEDRKQSSLNYSQRQKVGEILRWNKGVSIKGKKILFVDDVFTTGATCKACLKLIKAHHPRKVKALIMSKTKARGIGKKIQG